MFNDWKRRREIARRKAVSIAAIRAQPLNECVEEFVTHHISEIDSAYWIQHTGTPSPSIPKVLDLVRFTKHWGGDDELDCFDFTLPEDVTNYVIAVKFTKTGEVDYVTMES